MLSRRHAIGGCLFVGLGVGLVVILLMRPLGGVKAGEVVFVQKLALLIGADRHCRSCIVVEVEWWWHDPKFTMSETAVEKWDRRLGLKQCPLYTSLMFDLTSL